MEKVCFEATKSFKSTVTSFVKNTFSTVAAGLILTCVLFLMNEFVFRKNNLTGEWEMEVVINEATLSSLEGVKIITKMHLLQTGYQLTGSGEKIKEKKVNGEELIYSRRDRAIIDITGYYERRYIAKSNIYLVIKEKGLERESRTIMVLSFEDRNFLSGLFSSTAADSKGQVQIKRTF